MLLWLDGGMRRQGGSVHVDSSPRKYRAVDGTVREYPQALLRRSYRDSEGKVCKETLANISMLPPDALKALKKSLTGARLVDADDSFTLGRSLRHGGAAAAYAMAVKLGFPKLLGPKCRERDIAFALILSRTVDPASKLSTIRTWGDCTLGADFAIDDIHTDDAYAAMDWLLGQQNEIEKKLADRHLEAGGMALFDLSSSWVEGKCCALAAFGHSRDGKRGREQIEYGLLTNAGGIPCGIRVFPGNMSDSKSFCDAITMVRNDFGITEIVMVGDRGMITNPRVKELRALEGMDWVTALRAPAIAALARDDGPLQMSLFDVQNFAEITHPDYPGERLVCCKNPALAGERSRKREELLTTTEQELDKIVRAVSAGRLSGEDAIGIRVGKVINKRKVGKHFIITITGTSFTYRRDEEKICAESSLDGIYVIRTSLTADRLDTVATISAYKNLANVERDFRSIKTDDLDLRPIYHYLSDRVRAHVFICMLASYLTWHMRERLAPLTFTDERVPIRQDPVAPAWRSTEAKAKDARKKSGDGVALSSYQDLLKHLETLTRQQVSFAEQQFERISEPTDVHRRVFELIGSPIPLTLAPA